MVKRPKSPTIVEEAKYYAVYQPYPLNANWDDPADVITFCHWIATCIGTEPIYALHHKPKSRGMVLLEVDKTYPDIRRLLGEHRWSEFLKTPNTEEKGKVSRIFFSVYPTGREAEKDGWKRIHVASSWFREWPKFKELIQDPYPETRWCPVPPEDQTSKAICRPLPVRIKPPPPTNNTPSVPGSETWVTEKSAPRKNTAKDRKNAWAKGKPAPAVVVPNNSKGQLAKSPSPNAWNKPIIVSKSQEESAPSPISPPGRSISSASTSSGSVTTPLTPSGLSSYPPAPPGLTHPSVSVAANAASPHPNSDHSRDHDLKAPAMQTNGRGHVIAQKDSAKQKAALARSPYDDDEFGEDEDEFYVPPVVTAKQGEKLWTAVAGDRDERDEVKEQQQPQHSMENLWAEDEADLEFGGKKHEGPLCPVHKHLCKKGVCKELTRVLKQKEREEREERKEKKNKERHEKWRAKNAELKKKKQEAKRNGGETRLGSDDEDDDDEVFTPVRGRGGAWARQPIANARNGANAGLVMRGSSSATATPAASIDGRSSGRAPRVHSRAVNAAAETESVSSETSVDPW